MSATNAICGISLVGSLVAAGSDHGTGRHLLGFVAVDGGHHQRGGRVPHHRPHAEDVPPAPADRGSGDGRAAARSAVTQPSSSSSCVPRRVGPLHPRPAQPDASRTAPGAACSRPRSACCSPSSARSSTTRSSTTSGSSRVSSSARPSATRSDVVPMTAMPERIAISHTFGALAATLVGVAEYYTLRRRARRSCTARMAALGFEVLFGSLTFTGSFMAFGKLQGFMPGAPVTFKGQNVVNIAFFAADRRAASSARSSSPATPAAVLRHVRPGLAARRARWCCPSAAPTCRSSSRCSTRTPVWPRRRPASRSSNNVLIIAGALDGASGFLLSMMMCKAMNRSFANVLFGAFGEAPTPPASAETATGPACSRHRAEDAAVQLGLRAVGHRRPRLRHGRLAGAARRCGISPSCSRSAAAR